MSFDYSDTLTFATSMIQEFGAPAVLRRQGKSRGLLHDPTIDPPTFYLVRMVRTYRSIRQKTSDGGSVSVRQARALVEAGTVVPENGDKIMFTGAQAFMSTPSDISFVKEFTCGSVEPLSPGSLDLLYEIELGQ